MKIKEVLAEQDPVRPILIFFENDDQMKAF
jgi:hypothetical protein